MSSLPAKDVKGPGKRLVESMLCISDSQILRVSESSGELSKTLLRASLSEFIT